jgi:GWxTD domain-containing protein
MVERIHRLLDPKSVNGAWAPVIAAVILMAISVVVLAAWPSELPRSSAAAPGRVSDAESSSYDRWLNQEAVYIIGDEERAAFQKLTSDEERERFIQQFWERRNPNPGSPQNTFKEEHHRRIAFANQHFATSRPGWETDRGRIYIMYGPPDEIDSHAKGTPSSYAREVWTYRHVKGIGDNVSVTFVDWMGTGDYRIAPGNAR